MDLIITILPLVTKDIPISPRFTPYNFLSRCKFSTLTSRQPMVEFYLLTFPCFPLRKKENKSYFGKNRTHDFRTGRCAAYLLDHSGDELLQQEMFILATPLTRGTLPARLFSSLTLLSPLMGHSAPVLLLSGWALPAGPWVGLLWSWSSLLLLLLCR